MAFKTDTLQLKEYTSDPASATGGELAIVGAAGNRVLKLYDDGSWADVSASAGGGAAELNELSDVLSSPLTENHIAFVTLDSNDANAPKLDFGYLSIDMIGSGVLDTGTETSDLDTTIMSSLAIKNKIESYSYSQSSNFNHVQNDAWGQTLYVDGTDNTILDNITWVNTYNPQGNYLIVRRPGAYADFAKITVMNASVHSFDIQRDPAANPAMQFNCTQIAGLANSFTLESFQKAILIKTSGDNWDVVIASI